MKGRKPLASAIKEQSGAFAKDPQRRNKSEPQAKRGRPAMPELVYADETAADKWRHTCDVLDEMGVLTTADMDLLAAYCLDYSMFCKLWEHVKGGQVSSMDDKGRLSVTPEANQFHKYADRLLKRQAELGLTPSSRSRLHVSGDTKQDDPFAMWLQSRVN